MKTREFDIDNYRVEDIVKEVVVSAAKEYTKGFTHEFAITLPDNFFSVNPYHGKYRPFADLSKEEQSHVTKLAKEQYEANKIRTLENYNLLKGKCDHIFHDDKQYNKFIPELEHLYYCQAHTALYNFYSKKINSKSVSNSKYKARNMSYSTISCD